MNNSFLSSDELLKKGFNKVGKDIKISRNASFYSIEDISIGNNVRIDDFCILSGKIIIGDNVHISAGTYLFAGDVGIEIKDYASVSPRNIIFAISDDFSGHYFANAMMDINKRNVIKGKVTIEKYVTVGAGSIILPGVDVAEGCAIGAMSLVNRNTEPWGIYVGSPCKRIKDRSKDLLKLL